MHVGLVDLLWEGHHMPYVVYFSRYLTDRGHDVTFVTDEAHPRLGELPDADGLTVRTLPVPRAGRDPGDGLLPSVWEQVVRTRQLRRVFDATRAAGVDVVHLLYFDRTQIPLWATTRRVPNDHDHDHGRPPVVATLHRDAFTDTAEGGPGKRLTQAATRRALGATLADGSLACLTVHADSMRDRIIASVPAATRANTRTIPAPTPELSVDVSKAAAREHLDLPDDAPIALFFGGLRAEKGPDLLAEAVEGLDRPLTVVYAGSGGDFTAADVAGWQRRVEPPVRVVDRVGFVPEADLDYYFLAADVLVLPYRRTRGISGPLRRACAAGTPIVGNHGSDVGDVIEAHGLGWTFEGDAASLRATLATFLDERESFPAAPLERYAASQHWTETGKALETIYREATGSRAEDRERVRDPEQRQDLGRDQERDWDRDRHR